MPETIKRMDELLDLSTNHVSFLSKIFANSKHDEPLKPMDLDDFKPIPYHPVFSTVEGWWEKIAQLWMNKEPLPVARDCLESICINNKIYAIGGRSGFAEESLVQKEDSLVHIYTISNKTWQIGQRMPFPHAGHSAAYGSNGKIYSFGGYLKLPDSITADAYEYYSSIYSDFYGISYITQMYDPGSDTWSLKSRMTSDRVFHLALSGLDEHIYIFGGRKKNFAWPDPANDPPDTIVTNETLQYSTTNDQWTTVAAMPTAREGICGVRGKDGLMYVIGGYGQNCNVLGNVEIYNPATNSWTTGTPMPTPRIAAAAAVDSKGRIFVSGGCDWCCGAYDIIEMYDPASDSWTKAPSMLKGRVSHSAVIDNNDLHYILGGSYHPGAGGQSEMLSSVIAKKM